MTHKQELDLLRLHLRVMAEKLMYGHDEHPDSSFSTGYAAGQFIAAEMIVGLLAEIDEIKLKSQ